MNLMLRILRGQSALSPKALYLTGNRRRPGEIRVGGYGCRAVSLPVLNIEYAVEESSSLKQSQFTRDTTSMI